MLETRPEETNDFCGIREAGLFFSCLVIGADGRAYPHLHRRPPAMDKQDIHEVCASRTDLC